MRDTLGLKPGFCFTGRGLELSQATQILPVFNRGLEVTSARSLPGLPSLLFSKFLCPKQPHVASTHVFALQKNLPFSARPLYSQALNLVLGQAHKVRKVYLLFSQDTLP